MKAVQRPETTGMLELSSEIKTNLPERLQQKSSIFLIFSVAFLFREGISLLICQS